MRKLLILTILALSLPVLVSAQAERTVKGRVDQAEDTAHVTADYLSMCGVVRNDALAALCTTDGDNCVMQVDALGALFVKDSTAQPATSMACVEISITATGTAEQGADLDCKYVLVTCQVANTANCFVRGTTGSGVTGGLEIVKGAPPVRFDVGNTDDLWFDATTNDDDVRVCCLVN